MHFDCADGDFNCEAHDVELDFEPLRMGCLVRDHLHSRLFPLLHVEYRCDADQHLIICVPIGGIVSHERYLPDRQRGWPRRGNRERSNQSSCDRTS